MAHRDDLLVEANENIIRLERQVDWLIDCVKDLMLDKWERDNGILSEPDFSNEKMVYKRKLDERFR